MSGMSVRPLVAKEFYALLPAWLMSVAVIAVAAVSGPRHYEWAVLACVFGSAILGSQSIGHEYTNRTLTLMLSQPRSRRQVLLVKFAVLTVMLLALAACSRLTPVPSFDRGWLLLIVLNALCLAPLLTMSCRTLMAGVVFTGALPFWIEAVGEYVSSGVLWGGALAIFAAGAAAEWRLFMRLEAFDGRGSDLEVPRLFGARSSASTTTISPPLWQLVKKELHLQQMTFAVAAVWLAIWTAVSLLAPVVRWFEMFPIGAVSALYGTLLAILIGSLGSAEERQSGTLDAQLLLPIAAWKPWTVKIATAFGLVGALCFAGPVLLSRGQLSLNVWYAVVLVMFTLVSLYVSSLSRNTIRALTNAALLLGALSSLFIYLITAYRIGVQGRTAGALVAAILVAPLLVWFALENHRTAEPGATRVGRQVLWMAACTAIGIAAAVAIR